MNGLTIGVDVGGTKSLGVVLDADDRVVVESRVPTPHGADNLISNIVTVVQELIDVAGEIDGIGVGVPGLLDLHGRLRFAPNLVESDETPVLARLGAELGTTLRVDNDANCAARAELRLGAAIGLRHLVLVTLGTGIGTAVVINGEVYRGAQGMAGEFGHSTIAEGGRLCACGRRGCWEAYASGAGLIHHAKELIELGRGRAMLALAGGFPEQLRGEHVTRAARDGDDDAMEVLDEFARWVGVGLASIVASLDPEMVIIGGGLIAEADLLMPRVRAAYEVNALAGVHRAELPIEPAALGERSNALGAALMAREAV